MNHQLLFLTLITVFFFQNCKTTQIPLELPQSTAEKVRTHIFIKQAVYNGLVTDKFPASTVQYILNNRKNFFVTKCPICSPTEQALDKYLGLENKSKKSNVPSATLTALEANDKTAAQKAFNQLILKYSKAQKKRLNLTPRQLAQLETNLENDRKQGMGLKSSSFGDFCPSCDGACEIRQ